MPVLDGSHCRVPPDSVQLHCPIQSNCIARIVLVCLLMRSLLAAPSNRAICLGDWSYRWFHFPLWIQLSDTLAVSAVMWAGRLGFRSHAPGAVVTAKAGPLNCVAWHDIADAVSVQQHARFGGVKEAVCEVPW